MAIPYACYVLRSGDDETFEHLFFSCSISHIFWPAIPYACYVLCSGDDETFEHLFFSCPISCIFWPSCFQLWNLSWCYPNQPKTSVDARVGSPLFDMISSAHPSCSTTPWPHQHRPTKDATSRCSPLKLLTSPTLCPSRPQTSIQGHDRHVHSHTKHHHLSLLFISKYLHFSTSIYSLAVHFNFLNF